MSSMVNVTVVINVLLLSLTLNGINITKDMHGYTGNKLEADVNGN